MNSSTYPQKSVSPPSWFREKAFAAWLWPFNLVRDFPKRVMRLVDTAVMAGQGLVRLPRAAIAAAKQQRFGAWLNQLGRAIVFGTHGLMMQLFDLIGGPEIGQFLLRLVTNTTPLTPAEQTAVRHVLGDNSIRFSDVRIAEGGLLNFVFKINGNLAFSTWHTVHMPPEPAAHSRNNLSLVIHELTHVYQYEKVGSRYMTEAIYVLIATKRDCYRYGGHDGLCQALETQKRYRDFNREQQAQIPQDYYNLCERKQDVTYYLPYIEELRQGLF